jgi:predicted acetyltransferase
MLVSLCRLEISTGCGNEPSCKVIEANGGVFVEEFVQAQYDEEKRLRFCINLQAGDGEQFP